MPVCQSERGIVDNGETQQTAGRRRVLCHNRSVRAWTKWIRPEISCRNCKANMKTLAKALGDFHDDQGHFPPAWSATEPAHSSRVALLPFHSYKCCGGSGRRVSHRRKPIFETARQWIRTSSDNSASASCLPCVSLVMISRIQVGRPTKEFYDTAYNEPSDSEFR